MTKTCLPVWLVLDDVSFAYGRGPAVNQSLNLTLGPGIVGMLGPNGAGKSTLMRMLATLARPRCPPQVVSAFRARAPSAFPGFQSPVTPGSRALGALR